MLAFRATGDIIINEMVAATSERLLQKDSDGLPVLGPYVQWFKPEFDATSWTDGTGPIGDGLDGVGTDISSLVSNQPRGIYIRTKFQVPAVHARSQDTLRLEIDFQDALIVYLNGREVLRKGLGPPGAFAFEDQLSYTTRQHGTNELFELGPAAELLKDGENLLCIEVRKYSRNRPMGVSATVSLGQDTIIPLLNSAAPLRYHILPVEPSGGVFDPSLPNPEFVDWVELRNTENRSVNIGGWVLKDSSTNRLQFPQETTIEPLGYLVVLASGLSESTDAFLHAPFGLSKSGESLTLTDSSGSAVDTVTFPSQSYFHSFGRNRLNGRFSFFSKATPGKENTNGSLIAIVDKPDFDPPGGFYNDTISVTLKSKTTDSHIFFTLDGTIPTEESGILYTHPLSIRESTSIRSRALKDGFVASPIETATYLVDQIDAVRRLPALCLTADPGESLYRPNGVTAIHGGERNGSLWTATSSDDYMIPMHRGRPFEREASLEIRYPNGSGVQRDVGIRLAGSTYSRRRTFFTQIDQPGFWDGFGNNKPSFNVFLRSEYGNSSWNQDFFGLDRETYENFRLRAGNNDVKNPFIRDELVRRLFIKMGQVGSYGMISTLFVNGDLKGYYNPVESLKESFFQDVYDSDDDWDVLKVKSVESGNLEAWDTLMEFVKTVDMSTIESYAQIADKLDIDNFIDYLIVYAYGAIRDWPSNNWIASRERSPNGKWRFHVWDAESSFGEVSTSNVEFNLFPGIIRRDDWATLKTPQWGIPVLYTRLSDNAEFQMRFADRIEKHFGTGGALSEDSVLSEAEELLAVINPIMNHIRGQNVRDPFTPWAKAREEHLFEHFALEGLMRELKAPVPSIEAESIPAESIVELRNSNARGQVFYTLDGTDPRQSGGGIGGDLADSPLTLLESVYLKARVFDGEDWSPLTEKRYVIDLPERNQLVSFSEIMYHPIDDDPEFIEIRNDGPKDLDLGGWALTDGVRFVFPIGTVIPPGGVVVISSDESSFKQKYPNVSLLGFYEGKLDNDGERIALSDMSGNEISVIEYSDSRPWPARSVDGGGHSLVSVSPNGRGSPEDAGDWCSSSIAGGTPGQDLLLILPHTFECWNLVNETGEANSDDDGDGIINFLEYAFGTPFNSSSQELVTTKLETNADGYPQLRITTPWNFAQEDLQIVPQMSSDLHQWHDAFDATIENQEQSRAFIIPVREFAEIYFRFRVTKIF